MIWESKTWEEVLTIKNGKNQKKVVNPDGKYPIYGSGGVMGYADDYLCDEDTTIIGRKGSINNPIYVEEKFWNVDTAFGLMPGAELDNKFFYYYCTTYNFMKHNKATTLPSLTKADLLKIKIPLPPLDQQKTIAAILDAADTYRQKTKALVAKYDELTQSLFLDMFGDPVTNPKGWEVKTVYQVCAKIYGGGTPSKAHPEYYKGEIPWVTPKDMKSEYISNSMDHVNQDGVDNSSAKLIPVNSVLMVIRSGILKHTLPVAINTTVVTVNQDMKAYIPESSLTNSIYLKSFFQAVSSYLLSKVRAVTADNIEFRQIKELPFICPPIEYQNQFAEKVQALVAQKAQAQASLDKAEDLFNSLLQRAFKGELT